MLLQSELVVPMRLAPSFSKRPWGGERLKNDLGKHVPDEAGPWGEAWELSDHPDGPSRIASGPLENALLGESMRAHPQALLGLDAAPTRYPLLIKYIDAAEDLSVQVHPDDARAPNGDRGKTECWYVMDCKEGAEIIFGLTPGTSARSLRDAAARGDIDPCLQRQPISPGDFIRVPAGTVHAIMAGTLICEIQQSSNATYRLWDWNRQPARELHIEAACLVSSFDSPDPGSIIQAAQMPPSDVMDLWVNEFFKVRWVAAQATQSQVSVDLPPHGAALNIVGGEGRIIFSSEQAIEVQRGECWYLPAMMDRLEIEAGPDGLTALLSESNELA